MYGSVEGVVKYSSPIKAAIKPPVAFLKNTFKSIDADYAAILMI